MIAAERTGMPVSAIRVAWGDTDAVPVGGGTMGSRSLQLGGAAVDTVAAELVDKARAVAAERLEADVADVVLDTASGEFHVAGTPAVTLTWADVAAAAAEQGAELAAATDDAVGRDLLPLRCSRRRRRGRRRDRHGPPRPPRGLRRRRTHHQPAAGRGPAARRDRHGRGAGADGRGALRRGRQPDHGEPRGLRDDQRCRAAELRTGLDGDADAAQRRSAPRASASRARSARPPPCSRRSSMPSPISASAMSTCRRRRSGCGERSATRPRHPRDPARYRRRPCG